MIRVYTVYQSVLKGQCDQGLHCLPICSKGSVIRVYTVCNSGPKGQCDQGLHFLPFCPEGAV